MINPEHLSLAKVNKNWLYYVIVYYFNRIMGPDSHHLEEIKVTIAGYWYKNN